ncbi:unnamed protein product [Urochloa humidicola]
MQMIALPGAHSDRRKKPQTSWVRNQKGDIRETCKGKIGVLCDEEEAVQHILRAATHERQQPLPVRLV